MLHRLDCLSTRRSGYLFGGRTQIAHECHLVNVHADPITSTSIIICSAHMIVLISQSTTRMNRVGMVGRIDLIPDLMSIALWWFVNVDWNLFVIIHFQICFTLLVGPFIMVGITRTKYLQLSTTISRWTGMQ